MISDTVVEEGALMLLKYSSTFLFKILICQRTFTRNLERKEIAVLSAVYHKITSLRNSIVSNKVIKTPTYSRHNNTKNSVTTHKLDYKGNYNSLVIIILIYYETIS